MAATAERYTVEDQSLPYSLYIDGATGHDAVWLPADEVPALYDARQQADEEAAAIYEGYMRSVRQGEVLGVPLDSDSLSAGERALEARRQHGQDSAEFLTIRQGVVVNFQRYLAEAWSKLGSEYFLPLWQPYDQRQHDYVSYGVAITPMMARGITPLAEPEQVPLRNAEYRENATNLRLGQLVMSAAGVELAGQSTQQLALPRELRDGPVSAFTISECPEYIVERYRRDEQLGIQRTYSGYAPQVEKIMLRCTTIDGWSGGRFVEQMGVAGDLYGHDTIVSYLEQRGAIIEGTVPTKTEVLGMQLVTNDQRGVIGMVQDLDAIASAKLGRPVFLGRLAEAATERDYASIPSLAAERQRRQMADAEKLADYSMELAEAGIEHAIGNKMVDELMKVLMHEAAKHDPEMAAMAFDEKTAQTYREAQTARQTGNNDMARIKEEEAMRNAPEPDGCSGACEVRNVDAESGEGQHLASLLKAKNGDRIAVDESKTRRCKCGGKIAYAYSMVKVNKLCLDCGAFESRSTKK